MFGEGIPGSGDVDGLVDVDVVPVALAVVATRPFTRRMRECESPLVAYSRDVREHDEILVLVCF